MTPRSTHIQDNTNIPGMTRSSYWDGDSASMRSESPWLKKRSTTFILSGHESVQGKARVLPAGPIGTAHRQQFKRTYEDAFDFKPKDTADVKEEPRDQDSIPRATILNHHFTASKPSKPSKSAVVPKGASLAPEWAESPRPLNVTESSSDERSAIIATLTHVRDSAITEAVVAYVLKWAQHYATSKHGDLYDTAFIQSIFADLDAQGIEAGRRTVVTEMLTRPLHQQLESLCSSSENLRSCLATINSPQPSSPIFRSSRHV